MNALGLPSIYLHEAQSVFYPRAIATADMTKATSAGGLAYPFSSPIASFVKSPRGARSEEEGRPPYLSFCLGAFLTL